MKHSFSSLTHAKAKRVIRTFEALRVTETTEMCFVGIWQNRRFVLNTVGCSDIKVTHPVHDKEGFTLTLPTSITDYMQIVNEFQRFGASVSAMFRDRKNIEIVEDIDTGICHYVYANHHVPKCGSKVLNWEKFPSLSDSTCAKCDSIVADEITIAKHQRY
jgi:hypothetical protein